MKNRITHAYLYADGHAVLVYSKPDEHAGRVEWVEIIERLGPKCLFQGRIVIRNQAYLDLCKRAFEIRAAAPSTENGSENTRKHGIAVGWVMLQMIRNAYDGNITFHVMPEIITGPFTIQPEVVEAFDADQRSWGHCSVYKIHPVKQPKQAIAAVAA